jgi:hypothetical protein
MIILEPRALVGDKNAANGKLSPVPVSQNLTRRNYVSLQFTQAQKSDPRNYRPGQILVFHRATKNAAKHEAFEVLNVLDRKIVTSSENGATHAFTTRQAKSFDVFERRQMEIAPGDRLLVTANRRGRDFQATNTELVTVAGFDPQGRIQLEGGRTLPASFKQFAYGYAVTAQRSQGKTVDAVVISADAIHKELFQVAATRGRERIAVVTGNKEALKRSIGISAQRESVTELVARIPLGLPDTHKGQRQRTRAVRARQEALSTPAHTPVRELDNRHQAQQNPGPIQPNLKGIEYGIHP